MTIQSYRDLRVWQEAMALTEAAYRSTAIFPKAEAYGLTSQVRRAAVSIPANIAEGYGRDSKGSYVQFLRVSQGSLKELETHFLLAARLGLVSAGAATDVLDKCDTLGRMLRSLIRSVEQSAN